MSLDTALYVALVYWLICCLALLILSRILP